LAADCKGAGIPVRIVFTTNAKGYNDIAEGGLTAAQEPSGEQAAGGEQTDGDGKLPF
jgi:hypothetical protein